jgi:hypothetical protein
MATEATREPLAVLRTTTDRLTYVGHASVLALDQQQGT